MFYKKGGGDIWSILTLNDVFFLGKMEKTRVAEGGFTYSHNIISIYHPKWWFFGEDQKCSWGPKMKNKPNFFFWFKTQSRLMSESLYWCVHENLTLHRVKKIIFSLYHHLGEIRSFPTMYNTWGCSWGQIGEIIFFSPKKWSKNTNFGGNGPGSSNFEVGWDPQF